ncbi:unnamed protein product [Amoebophrya sp. A25]|nr:unnamed protein product [Amoebophrya sp. A25]|eukprot:GSA25T00022145001.1
MWSIVRALHRAFPDPGSRRRLSSKSRICCCSNAGRDKWREKKALSTALAKWS